MFLFDEHTSSWPARHSDPATSWAAGMASIDRRNLRDRLARLHLQHPTGLTDDDVCGLLPWAHTGSVSKRRHDLLMMGYLVDSGWRSRTKWGALAIVWCRPDVLVWRADEHGRYPVCDCAKPEAGAFAVCRTCLAPVLAFMFGLSA